AVMSSALLLREWSQSDWPADDFTLEENLADLERHEREHRDRRAFTFTVLDGDGSTCLGCVYITPLWPSQAELCRHSRYTANVRFWVRASEVERELDLHLLETLRAWLRSQWPHDCLMFPVSQKGRRQIALLQGHGFKLEGTFPSPEGRREWSVFRD